MIIKKIVICFILLVFCLIQHSYAGCEKTNSLDKFEITRAITNKNKKDCIEKRARSIRFLTIDEAIKYTGKYLDTNYYISNLQHNDKYWIAEIPKNGVESLIIQEEIFMELYITKASHVQLRFNFKEDALVKLYNQIDDDHLIKPPNIMLKSFALSYEAIRYENGPGYGLISTMGNPFKGNDIKFQLVSRAISMDDAYKDFIINKKHKVHQYLIDDSKIDLERILEAGLYKSNHNFLMNEKYDLLFKNCTNIIFEILDYVSKNPRNLIDRAVTAYPALSFAALKSRGIIKSEIEKFNLEKNDYSIIED